MDIQQVTAFADDSTLESYTKPLLDKDLQWIRMGEDSKVHSIPDILQRPVKVAEGEFNVGFNPLKLKFPDIIFQSSNNVVAKLDYFTYFRANICVRLLINATPFMSGRYWLFFAPYDSACGRSALVGAPVTSPILQNCTGFPGIEIDLATNSPVEIEIPYCSPLSHYNLVNSFATMGECYLIALNPIQTGIAPVSVGSGASFTMYAWFKDIDLAMPTSAKTRVPVFIKAQVGTTEEEKTLSSPISSVADTAASTSALLSNVPVIGNAARTVSWVSRAISRTASTFGWNKPTSLESVAPYYNVPAKGYTNVDGIDNSSKLCAMPDNGLAYRSGMFSTDVDEMDISHVVSKSCIYISAINWEITQSAKHRLHFAAVNPGVTGTKNVTTGAVYPTTLGYVSSMFKYWRGGLKYRITCAKTAFHTGRLRIVFHAGVDDILYVTEDQNAYNWILDLSVSSELEFTIPYVANVPWKETVIDKYDAAPFVPERTKTGILEIQVLTPLRRANDGVANNCPINIWLSGSEDFSLAIPDFQDYVVTLAGPLTSLAEKEQPTIIKAQVFNRTSQSISHNEQVSNAAAPFFPTTPLTTTGFEELSIGEKITSLRQLIKRFCPIAYSYPFPYISQVGVNWVASGPIKLDLNNDDHLFNQISLDPAYFGKVDDHENEQQVSLPSYRGSSGLIISSFPAIKRFRTSHPLYRISYLFRFYRGGVRYKIANPPTNSVSYTCYGNRPARGTGGPEVAYTSVIETQEVLPKRVEMPLYVSRDIAVIENGTPAEPAIDVFTVFDSMQKFEHYVYNDLNGTLEVEVPYYSSLPISVVSEGVLPDVDGPLVRRSMVRVRRSLDPRGMDTKTYEAYNDLDDPTAGFGSMGFRPTIGGAVIYEAAADDFSFGYLVGAPPIKNILQHPDG